MNWISVQDRLPEENDCSGWLLVKGICHDVKYTIYGFVKYELGKWTFINGQNEMFGPDEGCEGWELRAEDITHWCYLREIA